MICEAPIDPFILGAINAWGDVFTQTARDDQAQHPYEWKAYKTWRFVPDIGLLMWWESPDEGETLTVEDWLERKGYEVRIRSVMGQQLRVRENLKTLKGSTIKRFQNKVGKLVGTQIYVHRKYANEVIPTEILRFAAETLKKFKPNFRFNSVMWNRETNAVRFDEAPDFDTAREPHVGKYITISPDGTAKEGQSNSIWHHKWLWVKDDYQGFDVDKARQWSTLWIAKLPAIAKGTDASFGSQLKDIGLSETPSQKGDMIYGGILGNGAIIIAKNTGKHTPEMGWNRWIYSNQKVYWWSFPPDESDKQEVTNYLEHRGYEVDNHYPLWDDTEVKTQTYYSKKDLDQYGEGQQINLKELLMNEASQDEAALDYLKQVVRNGPWRGQVYLAGGAVRDMVMGKTPKDLDLVVINHGKEGGMDFARWLAQQMGNFKEGSNPVLFPTFGTAKVNLTGTHNGADLEGFQVEAVFARKEIYTPGSRKPEVFPGTIEDDVYRRDFTANSLMLNLTTDEMLDLTGKGKQDIKAGVIRTTSNPDEIFGQDALRMFRAVRFASKYNWKIEPETWDGIKKNLELLITNNTSKERIADELGKMLTHSNPDLAMELLNDLGLLPYIGKEFQQMVNMTQNKHHVDAEGNPVTVFKHTINVLKGTRPDLLERLIALFHDIGKVVTRTVTPKGVQFLGHEAEGPAIAERIMRDLKFPVEIINAVKLGVAEHMKLKPGKDDAISLSDATLRKFKIKLGKNLETVLRVIHADNMAHAPASQMPNQIANVIKRIQALNIPEAPELPYDGNEIIKRFGVSGEAVGVIQDMLVNVWYKKGKLSDHDADAVIKGVMKELPRLVQQKRDKKKPKR